jgi:predicted nucleotide-binding protein (sugar kinase/HSP70/actin superfamily)
MSTGGAEAMAAAYRSLGVDARVSPRSDEETLALAARFTTGEECLPQRVTLGNFLKVILREDFVPSRNAFFLPTSSGPCRFGQYAPLLRKILREIGYEEAVVFSPTSSDGYEGIAANVRHFMRTGWRAIVVSDILRKLLLMIRPYEGEEGSTDRVHTQALEDVCAVLEDGSQDSRTQLKLLVGSLETARDRFKHIHVNAPMGHRPLIGAVGEIYLRFNSFSNQHIVRRIEALGGEVWIADIAEWVWYTNYEEKRKLREGRKRFGLASAGMKLRHWFQHQDEKALLAPFQDIFRNRREARVETLLEYSQPYLPAHMALGEMTLNTGKSIAFYHAGCDGVVDISPFTCMNGIVTEVIYPHVSRDHDDMPMRIFYFDGVPFDLDGDLEIFMEQVKAYRKRRMKNVRRP